MAHTKHEMYCLVRKTSQVEKLKEVGTALIPGDVTDRESLIVGMRGNQVELPDE